MKQHAFFFMCISGMIGTACILSFLFLVFVSRQLSAAQVLSVIGVFVGVTGFFLFRRIDARRDTDTYPTSRRPHSFSNAEDEPHPY